MTLKSKPRKELVITERDNLVLLAIYHAGIIAAGHLVRLFWDGNSYGYVRLRMLADAGYLGTDAYKEPVPGLKKRRKVTSFYFLKKEAIDYLTAKYNKPLRPPWKNKPSKKKFQEHYRMGELWCRLFEESVIAKSPQWYPSRYAKQKLGINDFVPLHAVVNIGTKEKKYFALYYFGDKTDTRKISKLRNLLPAVDLSGVKRHIIICETEKTMVKVIKKFLIKHPENDVYIILHEHAGILTDFLRDNDVCYNELLEEIKLPQGIKLMPAAPMDMAPYWFYENYKKAYVMELITGSLYLLDALQFKGVSSSVPEKLYLYVPDKKYYDSIKFLLPDKLDWLQVVIRKQK